MFFTGLEWGYGCQIVRQIRLRHTWLRNLWATLAGTPQPEATGVDIETVNWLEIAPDQQLIAYFEQHPAPLVTDGIDPASPALPHLAANGVRLLVPLVTQGRLVGLLGLGEPVGGGAYSPDDLAFLTMLADEAAAAARIAQLLARAHPHE